MTRCELEQAVLNFYLSTRTSNCLINACWDDWIDPTPKAIAEKGRAYWMRQPNFGKVCWTELERWLIAEGYDPKNRCPACGRLHAKRP